MADTKEPAAPEPGAPPAPKFSPGCPRPRRPVSPTVAPVSPRAAARVAPDRGRPPAELCPRSPAPALPLSLRTHSPLVQLHHVVWLGALALRLHPEGLVVELQHGVELSRRPRQEEVPRLAAHRHRVSLSLSLSVCVCALLGKRKTQNPSSLLFSSLRSYSEFCSFPTKGRRAAEEEEREEGRKGKREKRREEKAKRRLTRENRSLQLTCAEVAA